MKTIKKRREKHAFEILSYSTISWVCLFVIVVVVFFDENTTIPMMFQACVLQKERKSDIKNGRIKNTF